MAHATTAITDQFSIRQITFFLFEVNKLNKAKIQIYKDATIKTQTDKNIGFSNHPFKFNFDEAYLILLKRNEIYQLLTGLFFILHNVPSRIEQY